MTLEEFIATAPPELRTELHYVFWHAMNGVGESLDPNCPEFDQYREIAESLR